MRLLLATLCFCVLLAPPATGGEVEIDAATQTVETPRFRLVFDFDRPEFVWTLVYKDWNPQRDIAGDEGHAREFWGQTRRGVDSTGFVLNDYLESHSWEVVESIGTYAVVRVTSESPGQPPVTTRYTFVGDKPWFMVERTVHFSQRPDSAAYQLYAPRVEFLNTYRALRWRDVTGAYIQRGYCYAGCATPNWDGRWLEHISVTRDSGFSVAQIYPASMARGTQIVRGFGPESFAGWVAPLLPAGPHTADVTDRVMVAFSRTVGDTASLDSLWSVFNNIVWTLDAPPAAVPAGLRMVVSPNPAAGPARFAWTLPVAARVRLEVLDVAGRRVALPFDGECAAGGHALAWDGRGADGRRVPAGLYLARLVTPGGVATARVARIR